MKRFGGRILFLDRSDINTDEIIPARYLTEITKEALRPHLLEDLKLEGFEPGRDIGGCGVIVTRANFGCGSSREHAPWALEMNGINLVLAPSFARIFRQNMFNCGMIALDTPAGLVDELFRAHAASAAHLELDLRTGLFTVNSAHGGSHTYSFSLPPFERELVEAGGWVDYADSRY